VCVGKGKVLPVRVVKERIEMEVKRHSLLTSALDGGEWCHALAALPLMKDPALPIDYEFGCPSPSLNTGEEKDLVYLLRVEPRLP